MKHWMVIWGVLTVCSFALKAATTQAWGIAAEQSLAFGFLCILAVVVERVIRKRF